MSSVGDNHSTDWLPGFVLDALTSDEMNQVSEHLASCTSCQAELVRLHLIIDELPLAAAQSVPSPELKRKLMQSIHSQRVKPARVMGHTTSWQRLTSFFHGRLPAFGIALIILLIVANLFMWRQINLVIQHTSTPFRVVNLTTSQFSPGAVGTLVMDPESQFGTLVVDNLTTLNPDKQYQVWLIKGTDHYSAGVFSVNPSGYASFEIQSAEPLHQYDAIGVSVEPVGGSLAPTGVNVFHGFLTR